MSVWNPDNIRDVAEAVGIGSLSDTVAEELARDVEFRIGLVLEEALKFMRHAKRTHLRTDDISQALRMLNVEPLYGYDSTRPLRFGEASLGPGQPLYYVEDEEVDFEKLINAPLPKVPREISFTAHWLAVEGVQPSIPQNPTSAESQNRELLPKGPGANPFLAAAAGNDNVSVKPLVKQVLSKESIELSNRLFSALVDETNDEWRNAALTSLRTDPTIHQLVPYFIEFVADKVTHNLKDLFILNSMMSAVAALLENPTIMLDMYIAYLVAPVLTCLVGKRLGPAPTTANNNHSTSSETTSLTNGTSTSSRVSIPHFALRDLAASILARIARRYAATSRALKPKLARSCLKNFLDPNKPLGTHYGAIIGLVGIAGAEGVRQLVFPNLRHFDFILAEALASGDEVKKAEAEGVVQALLGALELLVKDGVGLGGAAVNGPSVVDDATREKLKEKVGTVLGERVARENKPRLTAAVLDTPVEF